MLRAALVLTLVLSVGASPAQAQDQTQTQTSDAAPQNFLTFNPFLAAFGWYSGEFERVVNDQFTAGISGSYVSLEDDDEGFFGGTPTETETTYSGGDIFIRMFPQLTAPSGLYFSGQVGVRTITETVTAGTTGSPVFGESDYTFASAGFSIGFTYLFGARENYVVSLGAGVVKIFGDPDEDSDINLTLPIVRLVNLGFGF